MMLPLASGPPLTLVLLGVVLLAPLMKATHSGDGETEWFTEIRNENPEEYSANQGTVPPDTIPLAVTEPSRHYNSLRDSGDNVIERLRAAVLPFMRDEQMGGDGGGYLNPTQEVQLDTLVQTIAGELRESRSTHRSILNVIQERQDAQEQDLITLKNSLTDLQEQQHRDHDLLQELLAQTSNTGWAVADLKTSQDHLTEDVNIIKGVQELYNDTLGQLDELPEIDQYKNTRQNRDFIPASQSSLASLKKRVDHLQRVQHRQEKTIRLLEKEMPSTKANHHTKNASQSIREHSNYIPPISHRGDGSTTTERIGHEILGEDRQAWEEQHNMVDKHGDHLSQRKNRKHHIEDVDAKLARMQNMADNLSFQLDNLEERLVGYHQKQVAAEVGSLQASIANFTKHVTQSEQMQGGADTESSADSKNSSVIKNHSARIEMIENYLSDLRNSRSAENENDSQHPQRNLTFQVSALQSTVQSLQTKIGNHSFVTADQITEVVGDVNLVRAEIRNNERRITKMEIDFLNNSLGSCQKNNLVLQQEVKLAEFNEQLNDVQNLGDSVYNSVSRVEHNLHRLHKQVTGHDTTVQMLSDQAQDLITILPEMERIQREVNKMIMQLPTDCQEIILGSEDSTLIPNEGAYLIKPEGSTQSAQTYCTRDSDSRAWTRIQARFDGSVDFARNWIDYRVGFGRSGEARHDRVQQTNKNGGEFWIGNANLYYLTSQEDYILQIDMWDLDGVYRYARYDTFYVAPERENFALTIDGYSGNATDALKYSDEMSFSTSDVDNDVSSTHCAKFYTAGWWYRHCHYSNLNGRYTVGVVWFNHDIDQWVQLKQTVMRISRKVPEDEDNVETVTSQTQGILENLTTEK